MYLITYAINRMKWKKKITEIVNFVIKKFKNNKTYT